MRSDNGMEHGGRFSDGLYGNSLKPKPPSSSWWMVQPEQFADAARREWPRLSMNATKPTRTKVDVE